MANRRTLLRIFQLANNAYINSPVTFYTVDPTTNERTNTLATLYSERTGTATLPNPYDMDGDGKFANPAYHDETLVAYIGESAIGAHQTGIITPQTDTTVVTPVIVADTAYTLTEDDYNVIIECTNASPTVITVPPSSSVSFDIGAQLAVAQAGGGQVSIAPGAGVTLLSKYSRLDIEAQEGAVFLIKTGTDTWRLFGDLV